ncbi:hypothetical protein [Streptomyces sp. NPDC057002]|uniref:hypothetical protein n=1 Tax=Streptomyces sp. NPDC057002 TaxID=3345992 RepID=UPI00363A2BDC
MAEAQIVLSHSRESGIVAAASGERLLWAHTALVESGFQRDDAGVWHLPADGNGTTVVDLVRCARRHRTSVHTSSRPFIGDAARDLARLQPGQWHASVEIYSHPAWQEDLVPCLWDSGELGRAVQSERIPCAALLTGTAQGTTLLFIERPGRQLDYLVGAFAPEGTRRGLWRSLRPAQHRPAALPQTGCPDPHRPVPALLPRQADAVIDAETVIDDIIHGGSVPTQERLRPSISRSFRSHAVTQRNGRSPALEVRQQGLRGGGFFPGRARHRWHGRAAGSCAQNGSAPESLP